MTVKDKPIWRPVFPCQIADAVRFGLREDEDTFGSTVAGCGTGARWEASGRKPDRVIPEVPRDIGL